MDRQRETSAADPDGFDWARLGDYFAGRLSAAECTAVERWVAGDPARPAEVERMRRVWDRAADVGDDVGTVDTARALRDLRRAAGVDAEAVASVAPTPGHHGDRSERISVPDRAPNPWPRGVGEGAERVRVAGIAALAVIIAAGSLVLWTAHLPGVPVQAVREVAAPAGGRATLTLGDGTRLTVGPGTHLWLPTDFGRVTRTVELDGEALFAVVHDARRPFSVRTARTVVRDIGTTFAVEAYSSDPEERVAVVEGVVEMAGTALSASDIATVDARGHMTVQRARDVAPYVAWAQGVLAFKDTPLRDVARVLARAFDLEITIPDSTLAAKLVTASFADEPANEVLDVVSGAVGGHYERTGRAVRILRRNSTTGRQPSAGESRPVTTTAAAGSHG